MAGKLAWITALPVLACVTIATTEPITVSGARPSALRNDGDSWRPVRDSTKHHHQQRLPPPTSAYYMELGVNKKHFRVDPSPSNKVEVFAPAPPSILGSFSGFGHDTVKSRHPIKHKKPYKETLHQAESRPGYPPDLLSPPYHRHIFPQPFKQPDNIGQAYFFEASLSPPPRDSGINFVPPPSSKVLAPNSYYLQFDQQTRAKPTAPSYNPYLRQNLPFYGTPDYLKPSSTSDPYRFYSPEPTTKLHSNSRPTNSHGRPPGIDYFGNNPFGDIHLNTNKPELKTPAKDVFEQLAPLGRPFQSSTIDPPRFHNQQNEYSSLSSLDYYTTPGNSVRQTTPKPFRPSPLVVDPFTFTERPSMFVTPESPTPLREVYPIPVTTLDIPSKDDISHKRPSSVSTYQPIPKTHHYHEDVTNKPALTTYYKRPEVEVNNNGGSSYDSTPFLPTPSTDLNSFVGEPRPTELATPYSETNEVQNHNRNRPIRPRSRKKKPSIKQNSESYKENTSENNFDTPTEYTIIHEDTPKVTTFDTLQNNYQTEQEVYVEPDRYEEKPKKRRPHRPNSISSTSTFTNTESDVQETPTVYSTLPEDDVRTSIPISSSTVFEKTQQRRRKKPTNRVRGASRHGLARSTTTTTVEPPEELSSNGYSHTDYQNLREPVPTENYPFSGLSFNEYGHVILPNAEDSSSGDYNVNTLYPTHQVDEYQTNFHETITTTTTTEPTTTATTTTVAPVTTVASSTTSKSRVRNKYNFNNTRPRFSVKDYRERLNKATSTTEAPKDENEEHKDTPKIRPPRLRGNINYKSENQEEQVETSTRKFKPSYTGQRHAYRTSTTPSPLVQLDTPTTTERQNTFKPRGQRRPSSKKYYSRYRTSTEEPTAAAAEHSSTEKLPQRPKGVFSAKKRRPFPLRTRLEPTKATEDEDQVEALNDNNDNDLEHDQFTKKSDHVATTTLMTSSEEADWRTSSAKPDVHALDAADHGDITQKIADLTSSPSNSFDSTGFFKGASPSSSRRTVSQITLATEDPILPIEAFFSSSFNRNGDSR